MLDAGTTWTILCVDDEPDILDQLTEELALAGFQVVGARDGHDAIQCLADQQIDLVITDILMPEADGFELLRHAHSVQPPIPVICVTAGYRGFSDGDDPAGSLERNSKGLGTAAFFKKPYDISELLATVEGLLKEGYRSLVPPINQGLTKDR